MEVPVAEAEKKGRKGHFPWNEAREFTLVNYVYKEKGYIKTETSLVDKFSSMSLKIRLDSAFQGREFLDGSALKKKWDRLCDVVDKKYSLSSEGANLSGLEEEPSEVEKLIIDMLKEKFDYGKSKDEQKLKDKVRNEKMLTHEKSMLNRQDKNSSVAEDLSVIDDNSEVSDVGGTDKKKPRLSNNSPPHQVFDFEVEVVKALKDDPRLVEIEIAERRQKLEDSVADKAHSRDIENRRMLVEERMSLERSKAETERSRADQAMAAAQMKMMEMFSKHMGNSF